MRPLAVVLGICAVGSVVTCSPFGGGAFSCTEDSQCTGGIGGKCEASGFCSFADSSCTVGGQRYGDGPNAGSCTMGNVSSVDAPVGPMIDAPITPMIDALGVDAGPQKLCLGTLVKLCVPVTPTAPVTLPGTINTDTSNLCNTTVTDPSGTAVTSFCVVVGAGISVNTVATGGKPLVLMSAGDITVTTLDVASHRVPASLGAGASGNSCLAAAFGTTNAAGSGGGGGGGFGGNGGNGGNSTSPGGMHGKAQAAPTTLRGGCPGADGTTANTYGNGGGAVMLAATGTIDITGEIDASGSGSSSAGQVASAGASGAGSGGMIILEATAFQNGGQVFANGGSGAEGSSIQSDPINAGKDGADPISVFAAAGGSGNTTSGGNGGNGGGRIMMPPGSNDGGDGGDGKTFMGSTTKGGGGGGGGGVGVILTHGGTLGGNVFPAPTPI